MGGTGQLKVATGILHGPLQTQASALALHHRLGRAGSKLAELVDSRALPGAALCGERREG